MKWMRRNEGSILKKEVDKRAVEHFWFVLIILVVLLSRIPFLANGYGKDPDAWRVYLAAQKIAETGKYVTSRFPGYPVPEIIYSLLPVKDYIVFNSLTALLSVIATIFFVLILRTLKCHYAPLWGLCFAFLPGIYINSVNSMDYIWALCFSLVGLYFVLKKKLFLSAIFLGLAIGCRITSGALLIPFLGIIVYMHKIRKFTSLLFFTLTTIISGCLFFLPVFLTYGFNFISYNVNFLPIPAGIHISSIFIAPYGTLGAAGICISIIYFLKNKNRILVNLNKDEKVMIVICFLSIILYLIAYFRLPLESSYLVPAIPFLIIVFGMIIKGRVLFVILILFILSPFLLTLNNFNRITDLPRLTFKGPILYSQDVRIFRITAGLKVIEFAKGIQGKAKLVTYWLEPYIHAMVGKKINEVEILGIVSPKKLEVYRKERKQIIFLPIAVDYYRDVYGIDVTRDPG